MKISYLQTILTVCLIFIGVSVFGQITTSSLIGSVKDTKGEPLIGATVQAVHKPSGTTYGNITNEDGLFSIQNMRIGGPYSITVTYIGYQTYTLDNMVLKLGEPLRLNIALVENTAVLSEVEVVYQKNAIFNNQRTGTATNIDSRTLNAMPTLSRSIQDFTKLTPQAKGLNFAGMDDRFNNLTIDGSVFNNNFGLQALPGSQTNSTPISLDAVEEIQVNISPYDVRQSGFAGAGINAVTRSGTNEFHGSAFYNMRNEGFVGKKAYSDSNNVVINKFDVKQAGFRLGGPLIKNKLFFFINGEMEQRSDPGTAFLSTKEGQSPVANVTTRVLEKDLTELSDFLKSKFNYNPGEYENYDMKTTSYKALAKFDYNINKDHQFSIRYNYLRSFRDVPVSNSGGFNGRRDNLFAMTFQNSNYIINNDIYSVVGELNSNFGSKYSNKIIAGFTANRDYRSSNSSVFPLVDILSGGRNYITFGYEPFTPNNTLNTDTWQLSDNFTAFLGKHTISAGFNVERFKFTNIFTPTLYGQFAFNSLSDFYKSANAYLSGNLADTSVTLNLFQLSYSALDDRSAWSAITKATNMGAYVMDEYDVKENLRLTFGVRFDVPVFDSTAAYNAEVPTLNFLNPQRETVHFSTSALPNWNFNFSARVGFNWDVFNNKKTQIRGGFGLFSGRPAFVWLSNQVGNNGMLSGSYRFTNTKKYPFNPDPLKYAPATVTRPATSYNIAATEENFRFPQVFRTSLAVDQKLGWGMVASVEAMYSRTVNDMIYYQANLVAPTTRFSGADTRFRYPTSRSINSKITDATILSNTDRPYAYYITAQLDKSFNKNLSARLSYNYGKAKDMMSSGSIAFSSWRDNLSVNGNNYPDLGYSNNDQRHRAIAAITYRQDWGEFASTQITMFGEARNQGNYSYTYAGDYNFDGVSGNDLIYVPNQASDLKFEDIKKSDGSVLFTSAQQQDAWNAYVAQDDFLSKNKGSYFVRNGGLLPWVYNIDLSLVQEFHFKIGAKKNTIQLRGDIFNLGNLINNKWGVGYQLNTSTPLRVALTQTGSPVSYADNVPRVQMTPVKNTSGVDTLDYSTFRKRATLGDVWQAQFGVRYIF